MGIKRRTFLHKLFLGGVVCGFGFFVTDKGFSVELLNYESLYTSLYPKTQQEELFLKDVVDQIDHKTIPLKVAYASYRYAMKKKKSERIFYFEKCLSILCVRAGIKIKLLPIK